MINKNRTGAAVFRVLVIVALAVSQTGCIFFYRTTEYEYNDAEAERMSRFKALQVIHGYHSAKKPEVQTVYADRIYEEYMEGVVMMPGWLSRRPEVACRYAATPEPSVDTNWMFDIFFPIPMEDYPRVRCDGLEDAVLLSTQLSNPKKYADAWASLARYRPLSPTEFDAIAVAARKRRADINDGVRPYKVRAEAAVREKKYWEAADLLDQGLAQFPEWSQGHYNLALICEELGLYDVAIEEMGRYLTLVPKSENAQAIQDKIYLWQAKLKTP